MNKTAPVDKDGIITNIMELKNKFNTVYKAQNRKTCVGIANNYTEHALANNHLLMGAATRKREKSPTCNWINSVGVNSLINIEATAYEADAFFL